MESMTTRLLTWEVTLPGGMWLGYNAEKLALIPNDLRMGSLHPTYLMCHIKHSDQYQAWHVDNRYETGSKSLGRHHTKEGAMAAAELVEASL